MFANSSETSFHNWHLSIFLGGASFRIRFKFFRFTIWSRLYKVVCWKANWISFIDLKNRVDSSVSFAWRCDRTMQFGYFGSKRMKFQMEKGYIFWYTWKVWSTSHFCEKFILILFKTKIFSNTLNWIKITLRIESGSKWILSTFSTSHVTDFFNIPKWIKISTPL